MFGFNLNFFKKKLSAKELIILDQLQRYLTFFLPESLDEASQTLPLPGYIDWRYVHTTSDSVVKLLRCLAACMKIAPKSKQELVALTTIIHKYLAKPQNERSHQAELKFRTEISKIAPKIIQSWIDSVGFHCDKFWARYLRYHL